MHGGKANCSRLQTLPHGAWQVLSNAYLQPIPNASIVPGLPHAPPGLPGFYPISTDGLKTM